MVADAFGRAIESHGYTCYACAVLTDHVHLCIRKHRDTAEVMIEKLQSASRRSVLRQAQRDAEHPVWGGPGWKVFLNAPEDIERTIRYIRENPVKAGRAPQAWHFVKPYDKWPFHKRMG